MRDEPELHEEPTPAAVARRAGVTIKTLRHYEKRGLLKPRRSANGWRVFDPDQLNRLKRIQSYKDMGFGLEEIGRLLDASPIEAGELLERHEQELLRRVGELDDALEAVREARRENDACDPTKDPTPRGEEAGCLVQMNVLNPNFRGATSPSRRLLRSRPAQPVRMAA